MERRLQLATSAAFFLLCVVGIAIGVKFLVMPTPRVVTTSNSSTTTIPPVRQPPTTYQVGERIALKDVTFADADRTLLLVVRKGCRFCDESMPFYKQLGDDAAIAKRTRIVMVAPDDEMISREELMKNKVRVDRVVQAGLNQLKVRGTPTALVVDKGGVIQKVFIGKLDESKQKDLIEAVRSTVSSPDFSKGESR